MLSPQEIEATVGRLYLTILDRDKTIAELQTAATAVAPPKPTAVLPRADRTKAQA